MSDYIPTRIDGGLNPNFNTKLELEKQLKNKSWTGSQQITGSLTPKMIIEYKDQFVVKRVDDRTGRVYEFDTRTQKEYVIPGHMGGLHPVLEYYYEVNNIPKPGEQSNVNVNDIKYLEARIKYEQALLYKNKGDIKTRGLGLNTYNDKVNSDRKNKRFLEDGITTIYEASYDGKLNALELEMTNAYENSSYWNNDLSFIDTKVETKVETETKETEEKVNKVEVPVQRDERFMNMYKVQSQLDQTVNKNPMRDTIKIPNPKEVKTYDLRNLLQIEQ